MTETIMRPPIGFRFKPTHQELVNFLYNKVHGLPCSSHDYNKEFDLYGDVELWEVFKSFGGIDGEDLYFFTILKRVGCASRVNRKVGRIGGTWSGEHCSSITFPACDQPMGYCRRLRYENRGFDQHGKWIMLEYSLNESLNCGSNYVLCRIKKNTRVKTKSLKRKVRESKLPLIKSSPKRTKFDESEQIMTTYKQYAEIIDVQELIDTTETFLYENVEELLLKQIKCSKWK